MNVNGLGTTASVSSIPAMSGAAPDVGALPDATQTSISPEGGLFGQLASLAQTDPTKFKEVASEISQKLKAEAGQASGDQAQFLNNLADRFGQAAQTGDLSSLKPEGTQGASGHHGHRGHHKHAASSQPSGATGGSSVESISQIIASALADVTGATSTASGS